jgi:hypothetical protein
MSRQKLLRAVARSLRQLGFALFGFHHGKSFGYIYRPENPDRQVTYEAFSLQYLPA